MNPIIEKFKLLKMNTVEGAIERFVRERTTVLELSKNDAIRSAAYYAAYERMTDSFIEYISKKDFPILNDKLWGYEVLYDNTSIRLEIVKYIYCENENMENCFIPDEHMTLCKIEPQLLSIREYAEQYSVDYKTVTQWIRRGKIRNAKKIGNTWMIPEVTDTPSRGYTPASYYLDVDIRPLSDEYTFLRNVEYVMIEQDELCKSKYNIFCYKEDKDNGGVRRLVYTGELESKEKEKLELGLISHPKVKYEPNYVETLMVDVIKQSRY